MRITNGEKEEDMKEDIDKLFNETVPALLDHPNMKQFFDNEF